MSSTVPSGKARPTCARWSGRRSLPWGESGKPLPTMIGTSRISSSSSAPRSLNARNRLRASHQVDIAVEAGAAKLSQQAGRATLGRHDVRGSPGRQGLGREDEHVHVGPEPVGSTESEEER